MKARLSDYPKLVQLTSFAIVGGLASLVHVGVFHVIFVYFSVTHWLANLAGFSLAFIVSYLGQFRWTFRQEAKKILDPHKAFGRFLRIALIGLGLNLFWAYLFIDILAWHHFFYLSMLLFVTPVVVFLLTKFWAMKS